MAKKKRHITREEFDKILDALSEAFPPDPKELQKAVAKAQDRLVKEFMTTYKEEFEKGLVKGIADGEEAYSIDNDGNINNI